MLLIERSSSGYLLCGLEPFKVVLDESFEGEWPQLETSSPGEAVEGHNTWWVSMEKRKIPS